MMTVHEVSKLTGVSMPIITSPMIPEEQYAAIVNSGV